MKIINITLTIIVGIIFLSPLMLEVIIYPKMNTNHLLLDLVRINFLTFYCAYFIIKFPIKFYQWFKSNIKIKQS